LKLQNVIEWIAHGYAVISQAIISKSIQLIIETVDL